MRRRAEGVERTRVKILDAVIDIADPRQLTLAAVAKRAGVSERTVIRHFGSRSGLLEGAIAHGSSLVAEERFEIEPGDVEAAVSNLITHYETYGEETLWRLAEGAIDAEIEQINENGRKLHRRWVETAFSPQLEPLNRSTRLRRTAQLVAVCDVYTWKLLRLDAGLGVTETETAIAELICGITEETP